MVISTSAPTGSPTLCDGALVGPEVPWRPALPSNALLPPGLHASRVGWCVGCGSMKDIIESIDHKTLCITGLVYIVNVTATRAIVHRHL